jgi:hypothetical protein
MQNKTKNPPFFEPYPSATDYNSVVQTVAQKNVKKCLFNQLRSHSFGLTNHFFSVAICCFLEKGITKQLVRMVHKISFLVFDVAIKNFVCLK